MATVANKAQFGPLDKKLASINRKVSGQPNGGSIPEYVGERVLDITDGQEYTAMDMSNAGWIKTSLTSKS